ncbi:hypothetical protein HD806DRAFT_537184 [Xylariaceae sp. AK1471]|nr:hypothetical protein HD806DRAFT_537184 [Xylariaceae sp. AK1471]
MSALPVILSSVKIYGMVPELVAQIAGETEDVQTQRSERMRQLKVLSSGSEICKQFAAAKLSGVDEDPVEDEEEENGESLDEIETKDEAKISPS